MRQGLFSSKAVLESMKEVENREGGIEEKLLVSFTYSKLVTLCWILLNSSRVRRAGDKGTPHTSPCLFSSPSHSLGQLHICMNNPAAFVCGFLWCARGEERRWALDMRSWQISLDGSIFSRRKNTQPCDDCPPPDDVHLHHPHCMGQKRPNVVHQNDGWSAYSRRISERDCLSLCGLVSRLVQGHWPRSPR